MKPRLTRSMIAAIVCAAILSCSDSSGTGPAAPATHSVTFKVLSTQLSHAFVNYNLDGGLAEVPGLVPLPWEVTEANLAPPSSQPWRVRLTANPIIMSSGTLTCEVWVDGSLADSETVSGQYELCEVATTLATGP